ncbi:hypothetical protein EDC61_11481 [Sulfuritortus calidifontis]|uniref:DUF2116 family Zn-ribbon domain-containing protein n=1 Tax=Sulfuritortus calidifontis TaxID=1914471 RepID=A0A4V2UQI3_9PROT|nr:hypothetical protein [Sulfuritortus calidifontis]TCS70754.1 hypothetical protein EDC61_11481 [Sulfuritortus calidifontis]
MADEADRAQDVIDLLLGAAIQGAKKPGGPPPTGSCLNCGEPLKPGLRWCDADCRDDWQRYQSFGNRHHQ